MDELTPLQEAQKEAVRRNVQSAKDYLERKRDIMEKLVEWLESEKVRLSEADSFDETWQNGYIEGQEELIYAVLRKIEELKELQEKA